MEKSSTSQNNWTKLRMVTPIRIYVRKLLLSLILAIAVTAVLAQITYYESNGISIRNGIYQVRGFPFGWWAANPSFSPAPLFPELGEATYYRLDPTLFNFLFWLMGSLALVPLLQRRRSGTTLLVVGAAAFFLMVIDMNTGNSCLKGRPISLTSICSNLIAPNPPFWYFELLNTIFWLVIALAGAWILLSAIDSASAWLQQLAPPLILTLLSLVYQTSCSAIFCLGPSGRGFPLAYTEARSLLFFAIDFVFWWIVYRVILVGIRMFTFKNSAKATG